MESRSARLVRGWVVGAFATLVAATSHTLAGGGTPSALALVSGVVFGGILGTLALGRRPSLSRISVAAGGAQLAFHVGFSLLGTSGAAGAAAGHAHAAAWIADRAVEHHTADPAMWIAHGLAAVATAVFLFRGERALWNLLRESVARVTANRTPRLVAVSVVRLAPDTGLVIPRPRSAAGPVSRRGPPSLRLA